MNKHRMNGDWQQGKSVLECNLYMLDQELATDVTFEVGPSDGPPGIVRAHKYILISRSSIFEAMFCGSMIESRAGRDDKICITDVEVDIFREMLRYMYSEKANVSSETALPLMYAAKKYLLLDLVDQCQRFLQENLKVDNVCCTLELSLTFDEQDLKERCLSYISKYTQEVFKSDNFLTLSRNALKEMASLNVLMASELDLFRACVSWVRKQLSAEEVAPTTDTPSDEQIRRTLGPVLYCVRFPHIDQVEFTQHFSASQILTDQEKLQLYYYFNVREDKDMAPFDVRRRQMYEDVVCRFPKVAPGEIFLGGKSDAIEFTTDTDISLIGVGLYGSSIPGVSHNVTVEFWNDGKLLFVQSAKLISTGTVVPIKIPLDQKVKIRANMKYIIIMSMKGTTSYNGCDGKARVLSGGVQFNFVHCDKCSGRTSVVGGQIPQLFFNT